MKPSLNWLLVFVPITLILEHSHTAHASWVFFSAALSIVPIAALIVRSTEQLATRTGDAIGGLLNATFGNAPELIITIVALRAGYVEMVRASLIGVILANLLLALGIAFFLGGLRHKVQTYSDKSTRVYSTMMLLAAISLAIPAAFSRYFAPNETLRQEQFLNLGVASLLFVAYLLYLLFSLKTHRGMFERTEGSAHEASDHGMEQWSVTRAVVSLLAASVFAAWLSEILVGAAAATGQALGMTELFMGIVLLAIVGGAAESASAITVATKNKMDLAIGIALGSSIQIALFVAPALVFVSYFIAPQPLELAFSRAEIGTLFLAVLIGTAVCSDGQTNWFKGVQLVTVYLIMALLFYFMP